MIRRSLIIAAVTVVGLATTGCGTGPSEPMPPDMPMEVAADTLAS